MNVGVEPPVSFSLRHASYIYPHTIRNPPLEQFRPEKHQWAGQSLLLCLARQYRQYIFMAPQ